MSQQTKDLVAIIQANPGCIATIDNDGWQLTREPRSKNPFLAEEDAGYSQGASDWDDKNLLATDRDNFGWPNRSYGATGGCCYGGDILQALAIIVGINVESA